MKVRDMIKVMQFIETELNKHFPGLGMTFILVGSIAEGTRIHWANELDIMVQFGSLLRQPLFIEDDPFVLKIGNVNEHPLQDWCENGLLVYEQFLCFLLKCLEQIIVEGIARIARLSNGRISPQMRNFNATTNHCPRKKDDHSYTHCQECIFNVTQTKCGACLVFEWKFKDKSDILTIDLIPVIPIKGKTLSQVMNLITLTLLKVKPPNWLKYLRGFVNKDRILPESFREQFGENADAPIQVGMKLLHFGTDKVFIIRPAQLLAVTSEFEENKLLKEFYCWIKCLKSLLCIDISSYFIKKVILTNEMKGKIKGSYFDAYHVLQHPDMKFHFKNVIDYENWHSVERIPIIKNKVETTFLQEEEEEEEEEDDDDDCCHVSVH